jgi:uncharacterized protein YneF (UPF0154 family)
MIAVVPRAAQGLALVCLFRFFPLLHFVHGKHRPLALRRSTIADLLVVVAVVEVIIVGNFLARRDLLDCLDPHPALHHFGLAIRLAAMIDEHGRAVPVYDYIAFSESKQVGKRRVLVHLVRFVFADARARVFGDASAPANAYGGIAAGGVDCG